MKRNGFTLVELLAVIVILALLIVITANTVLPMMSKTKKNAMVVYADNVIKRAGEAYMVDSMSNGGQAEFYSIAELMGQNDYFGVVKVEISGQDYLYSIALFDNKEKVGLKISNITSNSIDGDANTLVSSEYYNNEQSENFDSHDECNDYGEFSVNLLNDSLIVKNTGINAQINNSIFGTTVANSQYLSSDYISIQTGKTYRLYIVIPAKTTVFGYVWYDDSKSPIKDGSGLYTDEIKSSADTKGYFSFVAPTNAKYLRFTWKKAENVTNPKLIQQ